MLWPTLQILGFFSKFSVGRNMAHLIKKKKVYFSSLMMKVPDHVYVLG
jgi:hypothetical protein